MNEQREINVAIIGGGYILGVYLEAFKIIASRDSMVKVVCGIDKDPAKDSEFVELPVYRSIKEMMDHQQGVVNTLCILTPPESHLEIMQQACAKKLNVICEKPPALSVSECERIVKLFKKNGCLVYFAWHAKFAAGAEELRKRLENQTIKSCKIVQNEFVRDFRADKTAALNTGALFDSGVNLFAVVGDIFDLSQLKILSVSSKNHPEYKIDIEWDILFDNGWSFNQNWLCSTTERTVRILTDSGIEHVLDVHRGQLKVNGKIVVQEDQAHTMLGEYLRQNLDAIKYFRKQESRTDYNPIALAQNIKSNVIAKQGRVAVC